MHTECAMNVDRRIMNRCAHAAEQPQLPGDSMTLAVRGSCSAIVLGSLPDGLKSGAGMVKQFAKDMGLDEHGVFAPLLDVGQLSFEVSDVLRQAVRLGRRVCLRHCQTSKHRSSQIGLRCLRKS